MAKDPFVFPLASQGQLSTRGTVISGPSLNDLVRARYESPRGKAGNTAGVTEFPEALNTVRVLDALIYAVPVRS
jgi:hypothetical protein